MSFAAPDTRGLHRIQPKENFHDSKSDEGEEEKRFRGTGQKKERFFVFESLCYWKNFVKSESNAFNEA